MLRILLMAIIVLLARFTIAEEEQDEWASFRLVETWRCFASSDVLKKKTLVLLTRRKFNDDSIDLSSVKAAAVTQSELFKVELGSVKVAGVTYTSSFRVEGFDRRWDFDDNKYSFIIRPDGIGTYYEFTTTAEEGESVEPRQFYDCVMS